MAQNKNPPNIILIVADDLGWKDVGFMGNEVFETPNLDKLADRSKVFTQGYSAAPVCSPSRASILTGKYPSDVQLYTVIRSLDTHEYDYGVPRDNSGPYFETSHSVLSRHYMPLEELTIAELLKAKGYTTCYVGKWHLGHEPYYPVYQGFDEQIGTSNYGSPPSYFFPYSTIRNKQKRILIHLSKEGKKGEYLTDRLTTESLTFIDKVSDKPFFISINYHNPHTPLEGKPDLVEYYRRKMPNEGKARHNYAAMIHVLDENIGRIIKKLKDLNITDETLVIFTSDNGGYRNLSFIEPLRGQKGNLFEGGIRVPVIISFEGVIKPGKIESTPISSIDFLPTILAFAEIKDANLAIQGKNFKPLLVENEDFEDRDLVWYFPQLDNYLAIRHGNYKFIANKETGKTMLYDIVSDPGETTDLSEIYPEKTEQFNESAYAYLND